VQPGCLGLGETIYKGTKGEFQLQPVRWVSAEENQAQLVLHKSFPGGRWHPHLPLGGFPLKKVALLECALYISLGLAWPLRASGSIYDCEEIYGQGWLLERKFYLLEGYLPSPVMIHSKRIQIRVCCMRNP
jgi:hypothetical protein